MKGYTSDTIRKRCTCRTWRMRKDYIVGSRTARYGSDQQTR